MAQTTNAICIWDFTVGCITDENTCEDKYITYTHIITWLKDNCKKFTLQQERGEETGYVHFQGRMSLKVKTRKPSKPVSSFHFTPTSTENMDNDFYCIKSSTRIAGPWTDKDTEMYVPRQIREITNLYPWQQYIASHYDDWNTRVINIIVDPKGDNGKTSVKGYMRAHKLGQPIPFCNDFKDILRMAYCMKTSKCYLIDIPRAIKKDKLFQMFAAIESLKDGYAYDDRHTFKEKYFDCPNIWVFTNTYPDISYLTDNRWAFWGIDEDKKLFSRTFTKEKVEEINYNYLHTEKQSRIVKK